MLANAAEWCYVGEKKPKVEAGTADDSEFKYLDCKVRELSGQESEQYSNA